MTVDDKCVVLVFKTNVLKLREAKILIDKIVHQFPLYQVTFDLEDCDKVLRIEGTLVNALQISTILNNSNYQCSILE